MNVSESIEGSRVVLQVEGRVDTTTAPELEAVIEKVIPRCDELRIDMQKLEYISSAGLRVLLSAHKQMVKKGRMVLCNVGENVMEVFEVTGFMDFLEIE
ncbi:MAG: STAS domain-containing protein [Butyrivibrio sp.]|jgi:anti-sigma B factor antagonist|nr:STAS domain-containing protein [Butyrivibrio sp.]